MSWSKGLKSLKSEPMRPIFGVCKGVVVVISRGFGCGFIGGLSGESKT